MHIEEEDFRGYGYAGKKPKRGTFKHYNWLPTMMVDLQYGLFVIRRFGNLGINPRKGEYRKNMGGRARARRED